MRRHDDDRVAPPEARGDRPDVALEDGLKVGFDDGCHDVAVDLRRGIRPRRQIVVETDDDMPATKVRECGNVTCKLRLGGGIREIQIDLILDGLSLVRVVDEFAEVVDIGICHDAGYSNLAGPDRFSQVAVRFAQLSKILRNETGYCATIPIAADVRTRELPRVAHSAPQLIPSLQD